MACLLPDYQRDEDIDPLVRQMNIHYDRGLTTYKDEWNAKHHLAHGAVNVRKRPPGMNSQPTPDTGLKSQPTPDTGVKSQPTPDTQTKLIEQSAVVKSTGNERKQWIEAIKTELGNMSNTLRTARPGELDELRRLGIKATPARMVFAQKPPKRKHDWWYADNVWTHLEIQALAI